MVYSVETQPMAPLVAPPHLKSEARLHELVEAFDWMGPDPKESLLLSTSDSERELVQGTQRR